jgi:hypothetical protein
MERRSLVAVSSRNRAANFAGSREPGVLLCYWTPSNQPSNDWHEDQYPYRYITECLLLRAAIGDKNGSR